MPKLIPQQYAKVLLGLLKDVPQKEMANVVDGFIAYLKKERAIKKLPYILDSVERYAKEADGIHEIHVTSAQTLSTEMLARIEGVVGGKVETKTAVDASLIGGIVVRTKNTILDASVKTQLARLKNTLE